MTKKLRIGIVSTLCVVALAATAALAAASDLNYRVRVVYTDGSSEVVASGSQPQDGALMSMFSKADRVTGKYQSLDKVILGGGEGGYFHGPCFWLEHKIHLHHERNLSTSEYTRVLSMDGVESRQAVTGSKIPRLVIHEGGNHHCATDYCEGGPGGGPANGCYHQLIQEQPDTNANIAVVTNGQATDCQNHGGSPRAKLLRVDTLSFETVLNCTDQAVSP